MEKYIDTKSFIACVNVCALIALTFAMMFVPKVPESDTFKILVGGLMTVGFSQVISYYFGSSQESKSKGDTINQIATNSVGPKPEASKSEAPKP